MLFISYHNDTIFPFRLSDVRGRLLSALADDFNTHKAMEALMDLVQVGNKQLQNTSKVTDNSS